MQTTFKDHFSTEAPNYAKFRPHYGQELFKFLAALPPEHLLAWDCATGSGQAAVPLAEFFDRVIATDASAEQILNAEEHRKVTYQVAPVEKSGLKAESCDLITVAQALHWFNLAAFYSEVRRVLKPRGVLAAWSYTFLEANPAIDRVVNRFYEETVGPFWPPERRMVENGYRDLPFPFEKIEAPEFSVTASWTMDELLGYLRTWSASKRYHDANGVEPVSLIEAELREAWPKDRERLSVHWPVVLRVGRLSS